MRCVSPLQPNPPLCFPDFPPIFHIKLKDQVLLEGEALTLCCLPAGSPAPRILWLKGGGAACTASVGGLWQGTVSSLSSALPTDKRSLQPDSGLNVVSCKDGRQMLTIPKVSRKDAGLYECAAANILGTAISSCTLAVARKEARETSGDRKSTSQAHGWGQVGAGHWSTALYICKRLGLLKEDRLVLHEHFQHL